jgi:hypothetical protein
MKTRSGLTSEATRVATRRNARCSVARRLTSASLAFGSPSSARSSSPRCDARSVRSIPVVTSESVPSEPAMGLFDHAMRRRPPSFVSQWPTCGLGVPVFHTYSRNSPNASRSSGGMTKSRASRPISSSRRKPVARSHASLKSRIRPSRSRTQTSDCVASVRILAKDSPTGNSADCPGSSIVGRLSVAAPQISPEVRTANWLTGRIYPATVCAAN